MKVYESTSEVPHDENSYLTLGTFDGIHLGHRKIIEAVVDEAGKDGSRSVLITFWPHPQTVVRSGRPSIELLTPGAEKIDILKDMGLDIILLLPFTDDLARMEPEDFVEDILVKSVGVRRFVVGYNHALGRGRRGREELIRQMGRKWGFEVEVIPPVIIDDEAVSSTRIRHLLKQGKSEQANNLLGRNYSIRGIVKPGENRGRILGFPTANIDVIGEKKLIPGDGVYAVAVNLRTERYPGMANIGVRPTFDGRQKGVEVHIHDFTDDLYDQELEIEFVERLRDEKAFDSADALASQMARDQKKSMELLSKYIRR